MKHEFNVGDRVEITYAEWTGKRGTITSFDHSGRPFVLVDNPPAGRTNPTLWSHTSIKPIADREATAPTPVDVW